HSASSPERPGVRSPELSNLSRQPANPLVPKLWLQAGTDAARPHVCKIQSNHASTPLTNAKLSKRCIKRVSKRRSPARPGCEACEARDHSGSAADRLGESYGCAL